MNTLRKDELTTSVRHFERISKSGIVNYNSEVPDTAGRKMRRRKIQAIVNHYAFYTNAIKPLNSGKVSLCKITKLSIKESLI